MLKKIPFLYFEKFEQAIITTSTKKGLAKAALPIEAITCISSP
jgi:hypothetical protein